MEKPTPSHLSPQARMSQRAIHAPHRHEGIANALRSAFDPGNYGLPDDMAKLLAKIDGK
jgi:hypothetical protein